MANKNATLSKNRAVPTTDSDQSLNGVQWLKYAGIGPARTRGREASTRLSGEEVTSLGSLEAELLGVLWEIGRPASGMDVMERSLYKRRALGQEPAAFATIATTLRRMTDKGLLECQKNDQRTPFYVPTTGRELMAARILNNVCEKLLGESLGALLPRMMDALDAKSGESDELVTTLLSAIAQISSEG
jgi:predicted transcriptional regulator